MADDKAHQEPDRGAAGEADAVVADPAPSTPVPRSGGTPLQGPGEAVSSSSPVESLPANPLQTDPPLAEPPLALKKAPVPATSGHAHPQLRVLLAGGEHIPPARDGAHRVYCVLRLTPARDPQLCYTDTRATAAPRWDQTFLLNVHDPKADSLAIAMLHQMEETVPTSVGKACLLLDTLVRDRPCALTLPLWYQTAGTWAAHRNATVTVTVTALGFGCEPMPLKWDRQHTSNGETPQREEPPQVADSAAHVAGVPVATVRAEPHPAPGHPPAANPRAPHSPPQPPLSHTTLPKPDPEEHSTAVMQEEIDTRTMTSRRTAAHSPALWLHIQTSIANIFTDVKCI
eukprot:GGOE01059952.1.p1 GENE.GGOE01059952.1~~GGOE01059952.1.p1  ORF type:complete len:387 (-),score=58.82 GGOE01059952.1:141-1169(-)